MAGRMTDSFYGEGKTISLTAPYARESGEGALVDGLFGVATVDVAISVAAPFLTEGEFLLAKTSAQAWTQGQKIYWDDTNRRCDSDGSLGPCIGTATAAAANPSSTGYLKLTVEARNLSTSVPTTTVAAAGTTAANGGALPKTGFVLVSAADATKGVTLPSAVAGYQLVIKNSAAAVLKVWPATGDAVNAGAVDAVFSCPASTSFVITAYDATTWYTTPLVPS